MLGLAAFFAAHGVEAEQRPLAAPVAPPAAAPTPQVEPALPNVSDPLLTPPEPAAKVLGSWQEALSMVRDESVAMRIARANVLQAQAAAREALAPALPQLRGTGQVTHHLLKGEGAPLGVIGTIPDPATFWAATLTLTVPLFHPLEWYTYGTAKDFVDVSRLSQKEAERIAIAAVADRIVRVVTAERLAEVSRSSLESALSTVDLTKRRAALGASNTLDVLRVEGAASLSRAQVVSATENLIQAREALGTTLGRAEAWGVTPDIQLDSLGADARKNCRGETDVLARTDVRAAQANLSATERQVKGVDFAYVPTVDAFSALSFVSPVSGINDRHETWTIGGLLTWNIYDGGLRGGQRAAALAATDAARANLEEAKRGAAQQVTQALRAVRVAEANLAVSAKTREINAETARLSKISFLNGSGTSFDLVTTETQLRQSEADLAVKEFTVLEARIAALLALSTCSI